MRQFKLQQQFFNLEELFFFWDHLKEQINKWFDYLWSRIFEMSHVNNSSSRTIKVSKISFEVFVIWARHVVRYGKAWHYLLVNLVVSVVLYVISTHAGIRPQHMLVVLSVCLSRSANCWFGMNLLRTTIEISGWFFEKTQSCQLFVGTIIAFVGNTLQLNYPLAQY